MVYSNRENLVYKLLVTHGSKKIDNMCQSSSLCEYNQLVFSYCLKNYKVILNQKFKEIKARIRSYIRIYGAGKIVHWV